ncbi:hypothetical protein BDN70DRAFT_939107 [Pholiota conissans]|uniref:Uncharacterized protein n=1 Tax=Pholiota conissans TaxID=109636 RepID=A0A9P5YLB1_9AGAR|nr:hypothetical protein BDN70DRAFT_939107 [Pholiota conissans]
MALTLLNPFSPLYQRSFNGDVHAYQGLVELAESRFREVLCHYVETRDPDRRAEMHRLLFSEVEFIASKVASAYVIGLPIAVLPILASLIAAIDLATNNSPLEVDLEMATYVRAPTAEDDPGRRIETYAHSWWLIANLEDTDSGFMTHITEAVRTHQEQVPYVPKIMQKQSFPQALDDPWLRVRDPQNAFIPSCGDDCVGGSMFRYINASLFYGMRDIQRTLGMYTNVLESWLTQEHREAAWAHQLYEAAVRKDNHVPGTSDRERGFDTDVSVHLDDLRSVFDMDTAAPDDNQPGGVSSFPASSPSTKSSINPDDFRRTPFSPDLRRAGKVRRLLTPEIPSHFTNAPLGHPVDGPVDIPPGWRTQWVMDEEVGEKRAVPLNLLTTLSDVIDMPQASPIGSSTGDEDDTIPGEPQPREWGGGRHRKSSSPYMPVGSPLGSSSGSSDEMRAASPHGNRPSSALPVIFGSPKKSITVASAPKSPVGMPLGSPISSTSSDCLPSASPLSSSKDGSRLATPHDNGSPIARKTYGKLPSATPLRRSDNGLRPPSPVPMPAASHFTATPHAEHQVPPLQISQDAYDRYGGSPSLRDDELPGGSPLSSEDENLRPPSPVLMLTASIFTATPRAELEDPPLQTSQDEYDRYGGSPSLRDDELPGGSPLSSEDEHSRPPSPVLMPTGNIGQPGQPEQPEQPELPGIGKARFTKQIFSEYTQSQPEQYRAI